MAVARRAANAAARRATPPQNRDRPTARGTAGSRKWTSPAAASASSVRLATDSTAAVTIAGHIRSPRHARRGKRSTQAAAERQPSDEDVVLVDLNRLARN